MARCLHCSAEIPECSRFLSGLWRDSPTQDPAVAMAPASSTAMDEGRFASGARVLSQLPDVP